MQLPYRPSLLVTIMRARYPAEELAHFVGLWGRPPAGRPRGGKLTNTIGGLVYVLSNPTRDLTGYRLVADGVTYDTPDTITQWADTNLPRSLAIARDIRDRYVAQTPAGGQGPVAAAVDAAGAVAS